MTASTRSADAWLPRGHVRRPRLVDLLRRAQVATVVAGGGWGKTTLALEVAATLECRTAVVRLANGAGDAVAFRGALRRACRRAGLSGCTAALDAAGHLEAALDALVDALALDLSPVLLIVDEVEHADGMAAAAIGSLATGLPPPHRALLVGRSVPPGLGDALDGVPVAGLSAGDLAFTPSETVELAQEGGIDLATTDAERLVEATGGWAAALTVALERHRRGGAGPAGAPLGPAALGELVRGQLATLHGEAAAVVQLAHLAPLPRGDVDAVVGDVDVVASALRAGIPLDLRRDGWVDLSGPVREAIAAVATVDVPAARRAAAVHQRLGDPLPGLRLLLGIEDAEGSAELLAALSPGQVRALDFHEVRSLVAAIGPAADAHPRVLIHLARACEAAAEARVRVDALDRAERAATGDMVLVREVAAERARDLVRDGRVEEAAEAAAELLEQAGAHELQTRVRALHVLGRTHAWRADPASIAAAEPLLLEAAELYVALGDPVGAAHALLGLAYDVHTLGGRPQEAVACLERAAAFLPERSRLRAVILDFTGEALLDLGREAEADAALAEADRLGRLLGDARAVAYAAWVRARLAARHDDADGVRRLLAAAEASSGEWFAHHTGVEFLAEAACLLDEVGLGELAGSYLVRARVRREETPRHVLLAEGTIAARSGDPAAALALLGEAVDGAGLEPRLRWRALLLRAWAAHRAGDAALAGELARAAVDLARASGHPELTRFWEPEIASALTADAGPDPTEPAQLCIRLLGELAFERAGASLQLPPGRPTSIVALLAATGCRLPAEQVIEALWPGVDPTSGRKRLRNVLSRLRESAGDVVVREGPVLVLAEGTEVDAVLFERDAERALRSAGAPEGDGWARAALARYRGDLLPDQRYEEWAAVPRERLRTLALRLADRLAASAQEAGELDDALAHLGRGIELDGLDEARYLRTAEVLLAQGRRGRALEVLRRSAVVLRGLGLEPSDAHRALVRSARA